MRKHDSVRRRGNLPGAYNFFLGLRWDVSLAGCNLLAFLLLRLGGRFLGGTLLASVGRRFFRAGCIFRCTVRIGKFEGLRIKYIYDLAVIVVRVRTMYRYGIGSPLTLDGCLGQLPDRRKHVLRIVVCGVIFLPVWGNIGQRVEPVLDELDRPFKLLDTIQSKVKPK